MLRLESRRQRPLQFKGGTRAAQRWCLVGLAAAAAAAACRIAHTPRLNELPPWPACDDERPVTGPRRKWIIICREI